MIFRNKTAIHAEVLEARRRLKEALAEIDRKLALGKIDGAGGIDEDEAEKLRSDAKTKEWLALKHFILKQ